VPRPPTAHNKVARELKTEPAAGHARCYFEEVGHDAFVEALDAFGFDDLPDSAADGAVLVTHARHCVDLEAAAEDIKWIRARLRYSS